jgi:two-component system, LuxR family, sensor kinase FixL
MGGPGNGGREQAFEALRQSEELHRATLSSISDAVFMADDAGVFTYVCPNVDVIFGFTPDEVRAKGTLGAFLGHDLFDAKELDAKGEIQNVEREVTAKGGELRTIFIHLKRVSIHGGTVLCTCRDVTALRNAEKQLALARLELAHAGRLTLVGALTASIVHEIQQPLIAISANAEAGSMHASKLPKEWRGEIGAIFSDIHEATVSAAEIVGRLRSLARKRPMDRQLVDLNELVAGVARLVTADASRRRVQLHVEMAAALPRILADRVSLQHVILNLVVNAMEAMEDLQGHREVMVQTRRVDGSVELSVNDCGPGISAELLPKIFEPFVTTKADGIGLGLSIARSIVDAHRGRLTASNTAGGATFVIALPVS